MEKTGRLVWSRVVIQVEFERNQVTSRTKGALAAAEARGVKLGAAGPANLRRNIESRQTAANYFANKLSGMLAAFQADDLSQREIAVQLNDLKISALTVVLVTASGPASDQAY